MNTARSTFLAAVATILGATSLSAATTYTVASGESLTLDASSNNQAGNQITLENGATLVAPVSGDGYRIDANVYVAGAARIDLASTPTSAFYLRIAGGLAAKDDSCSLTIGGGRTEVFFGLQNVDRSPNADIAVDGTGLHYPLINLKNLYFDATQSGSFTFRANSASTVVQVPTTCRVGFASGDLATLAMKGEDVFAQLGQTAPYSPTNFNAVVLDKAAIPAGTLVKVPAGRTMAVKPCNVNGWAWTGVEREVCFNVELEDESSILLFRTVNTGWTRFVGNMTGAGKVYVRGETGNSSGSRVMFNGDIACGGGLELSDKGEVRYGPDASWRTKVSHWFDAADTNSYVLLATTPPAGKSNVFPGGYPALVGWKDTMKGTNDVFCYNTRLWNYNPPSNNYVLQVVPYVVTNGLNGLNYICFGTAGGKVASAAWGIDADATEARRLPFWRGEADGAVKAAGAAASSQCKYAIMVFGSQQGGGKALLGTPSSASNRLTRNDTTSEAWLGVNASKYDFTVDGETVNPGTAKPNGAWQIVSIDMTRYATTINALGAQTADGSNATAAGGQNYAEVILFGSAPTEAERKACERYLAKKWGLTGSYTGGIVNEYRLNSANPSTSVKVFGDVTLSGVYDGAMTIDDRSTVSFTRSLPPTTEADLPSTGRVGWFDPEFEPTRKMRTTNVNRPLELDGILCRTVDGVDTTRGWFGGARGSDKQNRSPWIDESSHNGGPVRHWIDFRDKYDKTYDTTERIMGNMLRYRTESYSESVMKDTSSTTFDIRQAFMVLDTSAGGGTPLLDKSDASGVVKARYGTNYPGDTYSNSIHANGTARKTEGVFLNGKAWLNKTQVDPYTHGFTGKPEILTLETTGDFPVGFLAYYGMRDDSKNGNYEIMGETIFYSAPLSDEDRAKVQDYLMYKWLGKMDGAVYSDATAARVAGTGGTILATGFDDETLPNLSSFTGTLALSGDLSLDIDSPVTATYSVALPANGTLTVNVPANTASGEYTLLSAAGISGGENMALALAGPGAASCSARLVRDGGQISVRLHESAFTIIIR